MLWPEPWPAHTHTAGLTINDCTCIDSKVGTSQLQYVTLQLGFASFSPVAVIGTHMRLRRRRLHVGAEVCDCLSACEPCCSGPDAAVRVAMGLLAAVCMLQWLCYPLCKLPRCTPPATDICERLSVLENSV